MWCQSLTVWPNNNKVKQCKSPPSGEEVGCLQPWSGCDKLFCRQKWNYGPMERSVKDTYRGQLQHLVFLLQRSCWQVDVNTLIHNRQLLCQWYWNASATCQNLLRMINIAICHTQLRAFLYYCLYYRADALLCCPEDTNTAGGTTAQPKETTVQTHSVLLRLSPPHSNRKPQVQNLYTVARNSHRGSTLAGMYGLPWLITTVT